MSTLAADRALIVAYLRKHPSVSSAVALGHYHVLNGAPTRIVLQAIDALDEMPCMWTVAILEQAAVDRTRAPVCRRRAVARISGMLIRAIRLGYGPITMRQVRVVSRAVRRAVGPAAPLPPAAQRSLDDLCSHLGEAIADGYFGSLVEE